LLSIASSNAGIDEKKVIHDLLEPLKVFPELHIEGDGDDLQEPVVLVVLPVEKPVQHLELSRVGHDSH
jgi:hypothetical protein